MAKPTPVFLPGKSHGQRSLENYSTWGCKESFSLFSSVSQLCLILYEWWRIHLPMLETHWSYGFNPWVGKIPGVGNGNPLQYSCLENPIDRGVLWATVHGVAKESDKTERLSAHACARTRMHTHTHKYIYGSDLGHLSFKCWWNFLFKRTKDYWSESCSIMSYCLWPHRIYIQSMEFSSQNTGVGSLPLLQWIVSTQELNQGLLHCRWFFTNWVTRKIPQGILDEPILLPGEESGWKYGIMEYRCDGYCIKKKASNSLETTHYWSQRNFPGI